MIIIMLRLFILSSLLCLSLSFPSHYFIPSFPSLDQLLTRPSGRPFTISVEGNVGAGKSTLLNYFNKVGANIFNQIFSDAVVGKCNLL